MNQRWRDRLGSFRRPDEVIRTSAYDVAAIPGDAAARDFVERHHYSGSYPAARRRFGLYRGGELAGVAVFSVPCNPRVLSLFDEPGRSVELGRFVLLDDVPGNGETWFLARCFDLLRAEGFRGVISHSDPHPRATSGGRVVFPGHMGTIYQAANARFLGRSTARVLRLLPDGRCLSDRAISKIRAGCKGWRYAASLLVEAGADEPGEDLTGWLGLWLPRLTRAVRHPGNLRYAWALDRRQARSMPRGAGYPKACKSQLLLFGDEDR